MIIILRYLVETNKDHLLWNLKLITTHFQKLHGKITKIFQKKENYQICGVYFKFLTQLLSGTVPPLWFLYTFLKLIWCIFSLSLKPLEPYFQKSGDKKCPKIAQDVQKITFRFSHIVEIPENFFKFCFILNYVML